MAVATTAAPAPSAAGAAAASARVRGHRPQPGAAECHVTGGPPRFTAAVALCGALRRGRGKWSVDPLLRPPPPPLLSGGGEDGDVCERVGGGQEEPERGAGREREAVSTVGWVSCRAGPGLAWPGLRGRPT